MEDANFESALARIFEIVGSQKLTDLADTLGITVQAVSKAIKIRQIPSTWVYKLSSVYKVDSNWLRTGQKTPAQEAGAFPRRRSSKMAELEARFDELEQRNLELETELSRAWTGIKQSPQTEILLEALLAQNRTLEKLVESLEQQIKMLSENNDIHANLMEPTSSNGKPAIVANNSVLAARSTNQDNN